MSRLLMAILWPSFLVAILADGCFFSLFDPLDYLAGGRWHDASPLSLYTLGFFFFWIMCALASVLSCYLIVVPDNPHPPF